MKKIGINTTRVFFTLLRSGLWEEGASLSQYMPLDIDALYALAEEQSVTGLVAAGLEHVEDMKVSKPMAIPFLKKVYSLELRNESMNAFIRGLVTKMDAAGIRTVLVKGQGVAQCYSRPSWRAAGDVDLFFDETNYQKAKELLLPLANSSDPEEKRKKHQAMNFDSWVVELHGLMPTEVSARINRGVEAVQQDIFEKSGVREWNNDGVKVLLPDPDNDAIIIFTHFLQHFFVGGVGLRQISDWCRLLWTYRDVIDRTLLEGRLIGMGIMSEWKAFAYFAVAWLGMPSEAMPFYESSSSLERKARQICHIILKAGNFGFNKDQSYRYRYPKLIEKSITFWYRIGEFFRLSLVFPVDGPRFFLTYVGRRIEAY